MKHVSVIQHTQSEWLGSIEDHLEGRGIRFSYFRPFTAGGAIPAPSVIGAGLILLGGGPFGAATPGHLLPTRDAEVRLARACLMTDVPILAFGLGSQILSLAAEGGVEQAPLTLSVNHAQRTRADALAGLLPATFPHVVYMRDRPIPPAYAEILARDGAGAAALFQIGSNAFGFTGFPGFRRAMIEDLIMEADTAPAGSGEALDRLGELTGPIGDALVPIMSGLIAATGWMRGDGA